MMHYSSNAVGGGGGATGTGVNNSVQRTVGNSFTQQARQRGGTNANYHHISSKDAQQKHTSLDAGGWHHINYSSYNKVASAAGHHHNASPYDLNQYQ